MSPNLYYIGLMCGTSLDGIDAVLVDVADNRSLRLVSSHFATFEDNLASRLKELSLGIYGDKDPIVELGTLDREVGRLFAQAANQLLAQTPEIEHTRIRAIGSHGITIRHCPDLPDGSSFTLQIGDPNTIAMETGIDVVADLRRKDVALGGQGAPLVPAFHEAIFASPKRTRCILNIGGISNITILKPGQATLGYDTGPGNTLMDAWCHDQTGSPFDGDGKWARGGHLNRDLLRLLKQEAFFDLEPPKSTGKELFNLAWVNTKLRMFTSQERRESANEQAQRNDSPDAIDIQCTLAHLTAGSIVKAIQKHNVEEVFVCGGGVRNGFLMALLETALSPPLIVRTTNHLGVNSDFVEAMAFAWLASAFSQNQGGNLPEVTGAGSKAILGGLYKGR